MITATAPNLTDGLTSIEKSQLARRRQAVEAWQRGDLAAANFLLGNVLAERMTPRVAVRCFVSQAAFRAEAGNYVESLAWLEKAGRFIDAADMGCRGAFHNQRARAHKELGNIDAALMDYAGASLCAEAVGDLSYEGAAFLNIAGLYLKISDLPQARVNIDRSMSLLLKSNSEFLAQGYDTLANIELAEGHTENAVTAIQRAFTLVGENEIWRRTFLETKEKIDKKIQELSSAMHGVNVGMVQWALTKTGGNLTQTGKLTGLTHKGVSYIIDRHPELEAFRVKRRTRTKFKSVFKPKT